MIRFSCFNYILYNCHALCAQRMRIRFSRSMDLVVLDHYHLLFEYLKVHTKKHIGDHKPLSRDVESPLITPFLVSKDRNPKNRVIVRACRGTMMSIRITTIYVCCNSRPLYSEKHYLHIHSTFDDYIAYITRTMVTETRIPAKELSLGRADMLVGTIYHTCHHKFKWMLDYKLPIVEVGKCALCSSDFSCPVCQHVYNGTKSKSCPKCDSYFHVSLLKERREALEGQGIRVIDMTASLLMKYAVDEQKKRRKRHCAELQKLRELIPEKDLANLDSFQIKEEATDTSTESELPDTKGNKTP